MKTAIEWLLEELIKGDFDYQQNAIKKAKEMEKQQQGYSEEDLKHAFFSGCQSERQFKPRIKCWEEWFEQFKKK